MILDLMNGLRNKKMIDNKRINHLNKHLKCNTKPILSAILIILQLEDKIQELEKQNNNLKKQNNSLKEQNNILSWRD